MASVDTSQSSIKEIFLEAARRGQTVSEAGSDRGDTSGPAGRAIHDTVTLSEGGQKVANLDRGLQLAKNLQDTLVDENYADTLKQANDDVFRINQLFRETFKAAFSWWRS